MSPRAWLDHLEERNVFCSSRELNCDSLVVQPIAWSLYQLSCLGSLTCLCKCGNYCVTCNGKIIVNCKQVGKWHFLWSVRMCSEAHGASLVRAANNLILNLILPKQKSCGFATTVRQVITSLLPQTSSPGICGGESKTGTGYSLSSEVFACFYHAIL